MVEKDGTALSTFTTEVELQWLELKPTTLNKSPNIHKFILFITNFTILYNLFNPAEAVVAMLVERS